MWIYLTPVLNFSAEDCSRNHQICDLLVKFSNYLLSKLLLLNTLAR